MSVELSNAIASRWSEVESLVEALKLDVEKHVAGQHAAGNRFRRGIRDLRKHLNLLTKESLAKSRFIAEERKAKKELVDDDKEEG